MAIYDSGTASLAANGEVTGVGTTWKAPLTLIRVGATIVFKTEPVQIYTISEIISDTQINVYNPNSETVPTGTGYAILAHDGITVQGLAQDVAETLRYYQSRETEISAAVDAFNQFDADEFQQNVTAVNNQSQQVANDAAQVSSDKAVVSADKDSAAASAASALADKNAAAASAAAAADSAASLDTSNLLRVDRSLSDLTNKALSRTNLDVYSKPEVNALLTHVDIKKDFGAVGDGVTDDTQALLAAVQASRNNAIAIHIPKGNYLTSQPLNFLRPATIIGEKGARISLTSGPHDYVIQMDHRDVNLDYWAYNSYMSNIIVDGNGYATDGFSLRGVISSYFDNLMATNIRRAGLHCWWTQLCVHNNFVCSDNVEAFTTTPTYGILIDAEDGAVNFRGTSADLFINPTCEHVTESGIEATFCSNTTFIGGTSEGNRHGFSFGHESNLGIPAVTNTVIGCDLEVNSGGDVVLRRTATGNLFNGLQSGFESPSIQVNGARANRFVGGSASGFDFYNGASGNHVEGTILFGQNASVIDNSKLNSWEALYNINTGSYTDSSNPVQKRVQLSGGSVLFNPLRTSLATVVIDSSPVFIDVQDNARDGQRMDFIIYNLSGGTSPSVSFSDKFRVGSFTPPSAGRQIGMSFVYDANFAHWTCVGISPEGPVY